MSDNPSVEETVGEGGATDAATDSKPQLPLLEQLSAHLQDSILEVREHHGQFGLYVDASIVHELLQELRDQHDFESLVDVTAVDYLNRDQRERFQIVYILQNRVAREFLRVHVWLSEDEPRIVSMYDLFRSAKWAEREVHDMFGIVFDGNPDLRRFLMPEGYPAFPLLKDYPLKGRGERREYDRMVPTGDEMKVEKPLPYPVSIGRGMHTPEYLKEVERDSKPRS